MEPDRIVDLIYEAALVPERWSAVLDVLCELSGSASGSMLIFDGMSAPRWKTTERTTEVLTRFAATDAWRRSERDPVRLQEASRGDQYFHCLNDLMTEEQLARDSARQLLEEVGVAWQIGTTLPMPTNEQVVFTFERFVADGRHDPAGVAQLTALRPHLARAGLIATRLGIERARGALDAMSALGLPAALLDRGGRVRDANALMTPSLIETRGGGRAALGHGPSDAALAAILAGEPATRSIVIPATDVRPGRVAHVMPLKGGARDLFTGGLSLIVMNVAGGTPDHPDAAILRALFDLSPAEARLTAALATGIDLAAAAQTCGIRYSTARSYLEQVFRKTGCRRQAELVGLVIGHKTSMAGIAP